MPRTNYLKNIFSEPSLNEIQPSELLFFKKIILLCHQGEFKVNGQYPDKQFTFSDYLLDERRIMLDWRLLSESHSYQLKNWLIREHQTVLKPRYWSSYGINEKRGLPEEKTLSVWQRLLNFNWFEANNFSCALANKKNVKQNTTLDLSNININFSKNGALIDLVPYVASNQHAVSKDYLDDGYLQNVKRVILTDHIIDLLLTENINTLDLTNSLSEPHPQAIDVIHPNARKQLIFEYRNNLQYQNNHSFWWRIILIISAWWQDIIAKKDTRKLKNSYKFFCYKDNLVLSHCPKTGMVQAYEKKVEIDSLGLCGGGARIFSYLGVIDVLEEYGIKAKKYSGSSAGAIMASLLFVGYEYKELKEKFQWITDNLLLDYHIDFSGLSTTKELKKVLHNFISHRVREEVYKHIKWFDTDDKKRVITEYVDEGHITFGAISKLKSICPELNFGDELFITGTNITLRRTELFSSSTTPDMEIAEAVKISASMPVIYKPTVIGSHSYTDGGVLNNLPLSYFSRHEKSFISHELGSSLSVLALQFSTGIEDEAVYSNKPVYREHWLINYLYSFLIGITDPVSAWVNDRLRLRHYGGQSILIDVKGIKATKFDIDEDVREELINSGRVAAKEYIALRYRKEGGKLINDEYLAATFENLEALLIYCGNNKKWAVLEVVIEEIKRSKYITYDYRDKLLRVGEALMMAKSQEAIIKQSSQTSAKKLIPVLHGLNRMKVGHNKENKFKGNLFCTLLPILSQKWLALIKSEQTNSAFQELNMLEIYRKKLNQDDAVLVFNSLVDQMELSTKPTHLLFYILKILLIYGRNEDDFDSVKFEVVKIPKVFLNIRQTDYLNVSAWVADWGFNLAECKTLLSSLFQKKFDDFFKALGSSYQEDFDLRNLSSNIETEHQLRINL